MHSNSKVFVVNREDRHKRMVEDSESMLDYTVSVCDPQSCCSSRKTGLISLLRSAKFASRPSVAYCEEARGMRYGVDQQGANNADSKSSL